MYFALVANGFGITPNLQSGIGVHSQFAVAARVAVTAPIKYVPTPPRAQQLRAGESCPTASWCHLLWFPLSPWAAKEWNRSRPSHDVAQETVHLLSTELASLPHELAPFRLLNRGANANHNLIPIRRL